MSEFQKQMNAIDELSGEIFLKVHFGIMRGLKGDCTIANLLAYVLNLLSMKARNKRDRRLLKKYKLWFRCPAKQIQKDMGFSDHKQQRAINKLIQLGILRSQRRAGNVLWLKVNTDKIFVLFPGLTVQLKQLNCSAETAEPLSSAETAEPLYTKNLYKKQKEKGVRAAHVTPPPSKFSDKYQKVKSYHVEDAILLHSSLRANKRKTEILNKKKWANDFRLLEEQDQQDDYRQVLKTYCHHCSKEDQHKYGLPAISSAKQFRARYHDWIEPIIRKVMADSHWEKGKKARPMIRKQVPVETDMGNGITRLSWKEEWVPDPNYIPD